MRILITGSEGNIGRRLVPYLAKVHKVFRFDIRQGYGDDYMTGDVCHAYELQRAFEKFKPEVVYHMAAMVSRVTCEAAPSHTTQVNLTGTQNVASLCKDYGAKMIYFSTSEVYGNKRGELCEDDACIPNNFYGLTKYLGEKLVEYLLNEGLKAVTVRPFMFYDENEDRGDHRSAMIRFVKDLAADKPITVHKGAMRSWMHIDDAVVALERVMYLENYEIVNIGHPNVISVEELADIILLRLGKPRELINITELPGKMTLTKYPNLDKQLNLLGFTPKISVTEGINRVIDAFKSSAYKSLAGGDVSAAKHRLSTGDDLGTGR